MHVPDGLLSTEVCIAAGAISLCAYGYSLHRLKDSLAERTVPMTGMMAALIFAGQMINFPIALFGIPSVSGHLIGGVLAVIMIVASGKSSQATANLGIIMAKCSRMSTAFSEVGSVKSFGSTTTLLPYGIPLTIGSLLILAAKYFGWSSLL